ncbi:MAG: hypothetical protein ABI560_00960 [Myxococcales bacterium]
MYTGPRIAFCTAAACLFTAAAVVTGCGENRPMDGFDVEDGSLRGELAMYMADNSADAFYALRAPSGVERRLLFSGDVSDLVPGTELKVWGTETPEGVQVASYRVVSPPIVETTSALRAGATFPDRAFAFVLVDLGRGVNVTSEVVMQRMITDTNSIRNYYLYDSYGRQNISAQVFGPIKYTMSNCNTSAMTNAIYPTLPHTFQHYLWYLGSMQGNCGWSGLATLGTAAKPTKDTWYNASTGCVVLVQEPGHNFGMQHSSSIRCTGTPLANDTTTCTASEYGDPFDPMGGGCRHMNAWQKTYQGWFGGCNGVNNTSSGTFTLLPFEMRCDGAQFLKIKAPKTRTIRRSGGGGSATTETLDYYYVELRTPLDFDGTLGGSALTPRVLLHIANDLKDSAARAIHPYIIDMTPTTSTFTDAALAVGQTYTDPAGGLTITATAVSATEATIKVDMANGTGGAGGREGTGGGMGTGGQPFATGGTTGSGGADTTGTGGAEVPGTGGATTIAGTGGAAQVAPDGGGPPQGGVATGGSTVSHGPGLGNNDVVVGGCACSMNTAPLSAGTLVSTLGAALFLLLATRRRAVRVRRARRW